MTSPHNQKTTGSNHRNSLNMFRLLLAVVVLISHAYALAGRGEPTWEGSHLGTWAVGGFFMISGYLITASRLRTHFSEYLTHRIARIFPAFMMCQVVTILVFAPFAFHRATGSFANYWTTPNTPLNYVFSSFQLRVSPFSIAGTPSGVPLEGAWNGSLWSLFYEFICYLIIGLLAIVPIVKRSPWPIAIAFGASVYGLANLPHVLKLFGQSMDVALLMPLLPYFLGGALVFTLRHHVPLTSRWAPAVSVVGLAVGIGLIDLRPGWGCQAAAPLFTFAILWLAQVVPAPALTRKHDISYGVYIYTFPIQQTLVLLGLHHRMSIFIPVTLALVLAPATLSWLYLERPIMRRVRAYDTDRVRSIAQFEPAI